MPTSKRTSCIKTGASVHFLNYGIIISADVYRVGKAIIICTHQGQLGREIASYPRNMGHIDLTIRSNDGKEEFWRSDRGVFVVPEDEIKFHIKM